MRIPPVLQKPPLPIKNHQRIKNVWVRFRLVKVLFDQWEINHAVLNALIRCRKHTFGALVECVILLNLDISHNLFSVTISNAKLLISFDHNNLKLADAIAWKHSK